MRNYSNSSSCRGPFQRLIFHLIVAGILGFAVGFSPRQAFGQVTVCDEAHLTAALAGGGTITFGCDGTIVLSQTLTITQDTTLIGTGHNVALSGNNAVQVFHVNPGVHLTLLELTVANGTASGPKGMNGGGGGIFNDGGTATLLACNFVSNSVAGGIEDSATSNPGGDGLGGAIWNNSGTLIATNCNFVGNVAQGGSSVFQAYPYATGGAGRGGAIHSQGGIVQLAGCAFLGNTALGGPAPMSLGKPQPGPSFGGAFSISGGEVTVFNSLMASNLAAVPVNTSQLASEINSSATGGAIYQASGILRLVSVGILTNRAVGGTFPPNYTSSDIVGDGSAGGVFAGGTLHSTNCQFFGNQCSGGAATGQLGGHGTGGGIVVYGTADLTGASILGNFAIGGSAPANPAAFGGNSPGGGQAFGGGICNNSSLILLSSTIAGNLALGGAGSDTAGNNPGAGAPAFGGGIYNAGTLSVTNVTIATNHATGGNAGRRSNGSGAGQNGDAYGGGICLTNGNVNLVNVTMAGNDVLGGSTAPSPAGAAVDGAIHVFLANVAMANSIIAFNFPNPISTISVFDLGHNIVSDGTGFINQGNGTLANTDAKLGALGNYGGPTLTFPLLSGSPAIDAANPVLAPPTDERGYPRPSGAGPDVGAFEVVPLIAMTGPFLNQTTNSVTFTGSAGPLSDKTTAYFQYGTTTNYGSVTTTVSLDPGLGVVGMTNLANGLFPGEVGHYRLVAGTSAGTNYGADRLFSAAGADGAGYAVALNGVDQFVCSTIYLSLAGKFSNAFTAELWVNPGDLTSESSMPLMQWGGEQGGGIPVWTLLLTNFGTTLGFSANGPDAASYVTAPIGPANFATGTWHHVAATFDGANEVLYLDGAMVASRPYATLFSMNGTNLTVGGRGLFAAPIRSFNGLIDEARLWNVARSANQIVGAMNASQSGYEYGLAAYWRFDEGTGSSAHSAVNHSPYDDLALLQQPAWIASTAPINPPGVSISITNPPGVGFYATFPAISGTLGVAPNGVNSVSITIQRADKLFWTGAGWGVSTFLPASISGRNWVSAAPLPSGANLTDGAYYVTARAVDYAGNVGGDNAGITIRQAGVPPPAALLPNGQVQITFAVLGSPAPYTTYAVQVSADLINWTTIQQTNGFSTGYIQLTTPPNGSRRFYRLFKP